MKNMKKTNHILSKAVVLSIAAVLMFTSVVIADTSENNITLNKTTATVGHIPAIGKGEVELSYYDPTTLQNVIGVTGGTPPYIWQSAIRLTAEELGPVAGGEMTKVIVLPCVDQGEEEIFAKLIIYGEGTASTPGSILYEDDSLYFDTTDWYTIDLTTPIQINDHNEIWLAIEWEQYYEGAYVAYMDNGPGVTGKGLWIWLNNQWQETTAWNLDYNWAMGGIVEGVFADLACDGVLNWQDIEPGSTQTATITVENIGDSGSELDWEIDSFPDWGTWSFTPGSGTGLTPEDGAVSIAVEVIAPEGAEEFTGEVKIINSNAPADFCIIGATMVDAVSQPSLILQFIEALAMRFPILAQILAAIL